MTFIDNIKMKSCERNLCPSYYVCTDCKNVESPLRLSAFRSVGAMLVYIKVEKKFELKIRYLPKNDNYTYISGWGSHFGTEYANECSCYFIWIILLFAACNYSLKDKRALNSNNFFWFQRFYCKIQTHSFMFIELFWSGQQKQKDYFICRFFTKSTDSCFKKLNFIEMFIMIRTPFPSMER